MIESFALLLIITLIILSLSFLSLNNHVSVSSGKGKKEKAIDFEWTEYDGRYLGTWSLARLVHNGRVGERLESGCEPVRCASASYILSWETSSPSSPSSPSSSSHHHRRHRPSLTIVSNYPLILSIPLPSTPCQSIASHYMASHSIAYIYGI